MPMFRWICLLWLGTLALPVYADDFKLETVEAAPPKELSEKVAPLLSSQAYRVSGPDGVICELWLAKEIALKPEFKASLQVKYPFKPGELLGAVRLPTKGAALDFRGQELPTGVYTVRYGQQPQDGNHLGTSDVSDFALALPAGTDTDPAPIPKTTDLFKMSAKAAGTSHPAIFLLVPPPKEAYKQAELKHNEDKDWWILRCNTSGKDADAAHPVPLQIVVSGMSAG